MTITQEERSQQQIDVHSSASNGAPVKTSKERTGERVVALVAAMRPRQWTKNLALFVGIVFAQRLLDLSPFERAFVAFLASCPPSRTIYLLTNLSTLNNTLP